MTQEIKEKNTLNIPQFILKRVGLKKGDFVEVSDDGYKIIIIPTAENEPYSEDEWDKLKKIAKSTKTRRFSNSSKLLSYINKL